MHASVFSVVAFFAFFILVLILVSMTYWMWRRRSEGFAEWITDPREFAKFPGFAEYFSGFSRCDVAARTPLLCATSDQYLSQLVRVDSDANALTRAVAIAKKSIRNASPSALARDLRVGLPTASLVISLLNDDVRWRIAVFEDLAENGWPHTHGDIICVPRSLSKIRNLPQTLVHERVHVLQRLRPDVFRGIAIDEWGMRPLSLRDFEPKRALDFRRSNPDLDGFLYSARGAFPISLFDSEEDAQRGGLDAATTRLFKDGVEVQGAEQEQEHPYETQAYKIAASLIQ